MWLLVQVNHRKNTQVHMKWRWYVRTIMLVSKLALLRDRKRLSGSIENHLDFGSSLFLNMTFRHVVANSCRHKCPWCYQDQISTQHWPIPWFSPNGTHNQSVTSWCLSWERKLQWIRERVFVWISTMQALLNPQPATSTLASNEKKCLMPCFCSLMVLDWQKPITRISCRKSK